MGCQMCSWIGNELYKPCDDCWQKELRLREAKEWVKSEEGQAALGKAREEVQRAIDELQRPKVMQAVCTCCPVHGRVRG